MRGPQLHAAFPPPEDDRGRAFVGRAQHPQVQRLAHDSRREHVVGGDLLAEHGELVVRAVGAVLHDDRGESRPS